MPDQTIHFLRGFNLGLAGSEMACGSGNKVQGPLDPVYRCSTIIAANTAVAIAVLSLFDSASIHLRQPVLCTPKFLQEMQRIHPTNLCHVVVVDVCCTTNIGVDDLAL